MVLDKILPILPSRVSMLSQAMDALGDPDLNMIGIYRIEGIGKTTLAKEVHRKAVEDELLYSVVSIAVSQTPDLPLILGEIADSLGLKFKAEEAPGSASQLYKRLKNSEVLIILDDIWAKLDLRCIGIPSDHKYPAIKILLPSSSKDVLSYEISAQKDFSLEVVCEDEARSLFKMTVGEAKDPELRAIAKEIVVKCAGLPIFIIMAATYLKNKELSASRDSLKQLSDFGNEESHEKVHKVLKSNSKSLPSNKVIFPYLTSLIVRKCKSLKYIFKSSTVKSLLQLKRLVIEYCDFVEEIIVKEESINKIVFPNLDFLQLADLPNLKKFSNGYLIELQSLREFEIKDCYALKNIVSSISNRDDNCDVQSLFDDMVTFPNLQIMRVSKMENLEYIWHNQLIADSFYKLKSLTISSCRNLLAVFSSNMVRRFQRLEGLDIFNCPKMEEIYELGEQNSIELAPSELRHLKIDFLPSLKRIWSSEDGYGLFNFQNLKSVVAYDCGLLEYVFPASIACDLLLLEKLEIWNCGVKHIVGKRKSIESDDEGHQNFNFPQLTFLRLQNLRKLRSFYPKTYFCHEATKLDVKVSSNSEKLTLDYRNAMEFSSLKYIALSSVSFKNLTTLHVAYCEKLKNLVTTSTATTMVHLLKLRITFCEMMNEIVANDGDDSEHEITFDHLKCLELRYLPTLYSFCSGNYVFHFPLLKEVIVEDCLQLKIFCGGVLSTPKLQGVQHWDYHKEVQYYWEGNLNVTIASQCFRERVIQNANNCFMIEDSSSTKAILANELKFLNNLKKINIRDCDSIQVVFDLNDVSVGPRHASLLLKLEELQLINLPKLSELWNKDPMRMFDFRKLRLLKVKNCSSLRYAFTQSMASFLIELQKIEVESCTMMEAIIKEEEAEKTELSKITLPSLKKISIKGCPSMKGFMSPILSRKQIVGMQDIHEIAMPRLVELTIDWDIIKHKLDGNYQSDFFSKLKAIELVFPSTSFPTMEKLVLSDSLAKHIIIDELNNHHNLLPRLRKIILSKLPNLEHMVYDDDSVFLNLQVLKVWQCSKLKTLVPSSVSFHNLTFLQVSTCNEMINLITISMAKSLVHLKMMYVGRCKMMEEIVAVGLVGEKDEIGFLRLEYLVLDDLPWLASFCSSKNTFNFPCLEEVFVIKCPSMKMFAQVANTPKLNQVQTGGKEHEWEWEGSLNNTIQALFRKRIVEETNA